jgi:biopolymer transport protein ExbD
MAARLDDGDDLAETHEINVTPFIDVILVLLIIFMVAAPLATVDVPVDLPVSTATRTPRPDKPLFLTLKEDLSLVVGEKATARADLAQALDAATSQDREQRVFVRAARKVDYGQLTDLMNDLRKAGYLKIALVGLEGEARPQ